MARGLQTARFHFNPRTYMRCDLVVPELIFTLHNFNPRTYVRCDVFPCPNRLATDYFNPRTYVRCDSQVLRLIHQHHSFQSTHLREVRRIIRNSNFVRNKFQSTHLREVRQFYSFLYLNQFQFQSTHLREVRLKRHIISSKST